MQANPTHSRFLDASWYGRYQSCIVGGAGGIGSWLTLFLARQGHSIYLYDFDTVEEHNIGGQLYSTEDIGLSKVSATYTNVQRFTNNSIYSINERYDENSFPGPVMFACFDNMASRKLMVEKWVQHNFFPDRVPVPDELFLFMDGRLNAETADILCLQTKEDVERYLKDDYFEDSKVADAPCTFKATSHCGAILAGMMTSIFNNAIANKFANEGRSVPYKTSIYLPTVNVITDES